LAPGLVGAPSFYTGCSAGPTRPGPARCGPAPVAVEIRSERQTGAAQKERTVKKKDERRIREGEGGGCRQGRASRAGT